MPWLIEGEKKTKEKKQKGGPPLTEGTGRSAEERGLAWRAGQRRERRHGFDLTEPCDHER